MHLLHTEIQSVRPRYASTTPLPDPHDPDFLHKVMCEAGSVAEEACRGLDSLGPHRIQVSINETPGCSDALVPTEPADSLRQDDPRRGHGPASSGARPREHEDQTNEQKSVNIGE
jgi:hypothetical protein